MTKAKKVKEEKFTKHGKEVCGKDKKTVEEVVTKLMEMNRHFDPAELRAKLDGFTKDDHLTEPKKKEDDKSEDGDDDDKKKKKEKKDDKKKEDKGDDEWARWFWSLIH